MANGCGYVATDGACVRTCSWELEAINGRQMLSKISSQENYSAAEGNQHAELVVMDVGVAGGVDLLDAGDQSWRTSIIDIKSLIIGNACTTRLCRFMKFSTER